MGLAPISPLAGALLWATTVIGDKYGAAVVGAVDIATAAPYIGLAAFVAALYNKQNIACIHHTKQYFVCKSIQIWLGISAIIVLIYEYDAGDGDGDGDMGSGDMGLVIE